MTPFAIIVCWDGPSASTERVAKLLGPVRPRCPDGVTCAEVPGAAVAVGLRAVVPGEDLSAGFLVDENRRRMIVGDIRLYGRQTLLDRLGSGDAGDADIALVARLLDRFGDDALADLVGDFAFVVWDWGDRKLWAARDHFGMRSLHYRFVPGGLALATDVRSLLALGSPGNSVDAEIDENMVLDYLLSDRGHRGRTHFRDVKQVRPAHRLMARDGYLGETRYWLPPTTPIRRARYQDYVDEWRDLFRRAVNDRLRSAYPIATHLSGGLDSTSIAGAAHGLYEEEPEGRPPLLMLSALFPGLDCDETPYIDATAERLPLFESLRWNAALRDSTDFESPLLSAPGVPRGPRAGPWGDLQIAREGGARVLLTGDGGDEVGWARGVFQDLLQHVQLLTFVRELAAQQSWSARRRRIREGLKGLLPPAFVDAVRGNSWVRGPAPDWLGPELMRTFPGVPDDEPEPGLRFTSHTQREIWRVFASPRSFAAMDVPLLVAAEAGLETRAPFLDVRLVNFVLGIPWQFRLPHGDMRRLERDGIRPFVPPSVASRLAKTVFASAIHNQIRLNQSRIREIVFDSNWACAPYVRQTGAQVLFAECLARDPEARHWRPWRQVWKIASLEAWLRGVRAYNAP